MKWYECGGCMAEFRVISDTDAFIEYCPFCGTEIPVEDEEYEDDD